MQKIAHSHTSDLKAIITKHLFIKNNVTETSFDALKLIGTKVKSIIAENASLLLAHRYECGTIIRTKNAKYKNVDGVFSEYWNV